MRIGILTLPLNTNYGGIMQAYALQTVLERMGHEVSVISLKHQYPSGIIGHLKEYVFSPIKQWILRTVIPASFVNNKNYYTNKFIRKRINIALYHSFSEIMPYEYDAIVVGSDQIWRKKYVCGSYKRSIESSFLDFAETWNIKKLSYAASFGTDLWEYNEQQTNNCKKLIHKFNAISVREKSGIMLCKRFLNANAVQVLDPTLLLTKEDYCALVKNLHPQKKHILMTYILDFDINKENIINLIAGTLNIKVFKANQEEIDKLTSHKNIKQPPIEYWICGFRDADFIITDSFHACVFSIIFNKPFIVIPNYERGFSRFESLLSLFKQDFRLIKDPTNFTLNDEIKKSPNCNIENLKDVSLRFLKMNL